MKRALLIAALSLMTAACSSPKPSARDSTEALCAAEALKAARASGVAFDREERMRREVELFTARVEAKGLFDASGRIDELADQSMGRTLIRRETCRALLTAGERRQLETPPRGPFTDLRRSMPR